MSRFHYIAIALLFIGGMAYGINQDARHHWSNSRLQEWLPEEYANPAVSWTGKYKNRDPEQGPAFFGSTTVFVWITDLDHLTKAAQRLAQRLGWVVLLLGWLKSGKGTWTERKWLTGLYLILAAAAIEAAGFHFTYTIILPQ